MQAVANPPLKPGYETNARATTVTFRLTPTTVKRH